MNEQQKKDIKNILDNLKGHETMSLEQLRYKIAITKSVLKMLLNDPVQK